MGILVFLLLALGVGFICHHQSAKANTEGSDFFYSEYPMEQ